MGQERGTWAWLDRTAESGRTRDEEVRTQAFWIWLKAASSLYSALRNVHSPLRNVYSPLRNVHSAVRNINRTGLRRKSVQAIWKHSDSHRANIHWQNRPVRASWSMTANKCRCHIWIKWVFLTKKQKKNFEAKRFYPIFAAGKDRQENRSEKQRISIYNSVHIIRYI